MNLGCVIMEVAEKEDGDSSTNCTELTANSEKFNFNVKSFFKDHINFIKSYFPCKNRIYSRFSLLINNLITLKVTYDSNTRNIASSVISYRMWGVMGWQQKI